MKKETMKLCILFTLMTLLLSNFIPIISVSAEESTTSHETLVIAENEFLGEDGKVYTETDLIKAFDNDEIEIINIGGYKARSAGLGALGYFLGSSVAIPGIGTVVVGAAGLIIGGVVVFKVGSWAWEKAKAYFADEDNWTADQIISKKRRGSIRREFPTEYLGKKLRDIKKEAKAGKARARKAKKLLENGRFKK